jgi:hypothetical protein
LLNYIIIFIYNYNYNNNYYLFLVLKQTFQINIQIIKAVIHKEMKINLILISYRNKIQNLTKVYIIFDLILYIILFLKIFYYNINSKFNFLIIIVEELEQN